jgi:hypothetical protein
MSSDFLGKTIRLAFIFAGIGLFLILADAGYYQATDDHLSYVEAFFGLLGLMFGAVTTKNAADNFFAMSERKTYYSQTGQVPPNAPPQPQI